MGSSELSVDPKSQALFSILRWKRDASLRVSVGWIDGKNKGFDVPYFCYNYFSRRSKFCPRAIQER